MTRIAFPTFICAAAAVLAAIPLPAFAVDDVRPSILDNKNLMPADSNTRPYMRCPAGEFLIGIGLNHTDRVIGYSFKCSKNQPNARWDPNVNPPYFKQLGQANARTAQWAECPRDSYIIGLRATTGRYSADTHGLAKPVPLPLIADLQPLCWRFGDQTSFYQIQRAYFEKADDNHLADTASPFGSPKSCPSPTVAVGLIFRVDFRRDLDPDSQFQDVALICERLVNLAPNPTLITTYTPPKPPPKGGPGRGGH